MERNTRHITGRIHGENNRFIGVGIFVNRKSNKKGNQDDGLFSLNITSAEGQNQLGLQRIVNYIQN